jgi:tetratricopeptide (TPR) repeat protein
MDDIHLSREILRAFEARELPWQAVVEIALDHLMSHCPHCRAEVEAHEVERRARAFGPGRVLPILRSLGEQEARRHSKEEVDAKGDLAEILSLPAANRAARIERARTRFRSPVLARLLLEESRGCLPGRPSEGLHFADLARKVVNRNPRSPEYFDLYALSTAFIGNACRAGGNLGDASQHFAHARQVMAQHGVTNPEVVARVDDLIGSLRKDQRRLRDSEKLLKRAAALFELIHASDDAARVLIKLGAVYNHQKDANRAIETTRSGLALLGPDAEPRLHLCGTYNLAFYLTAAGRFEEAAEVLEWNEALFRRFPEPWTQLRLLWLRGDIDLGLGHLAAAEQAYAGTRDGFIAQGIGYDAAMVSLDLAVLYLRQGRTGDVRRIAEEMIPLFQSQDVHPEAMAALALFQEAARQDRLTVEMTTEIAARLREARLEPGGRFS